MPDQNGGPRSFFCPQIALDAVADTGGGSLDGIAGEVSVAGGRLDLGMAKELPDHRQPFAEHQGARSEGVPQVMDAHVGEPGP